LTSAPFCGLRDGSSVNQISTNEPSFALECWLGTQKDLVASLICPSLTQIMSPDVFECIDQVGSNARVTAVRARVSANRVTPVHDVIEARVVSRYINAGANKIWQRTALSQCRVTAEVAYDKAGLFPTRLVFTSTCVA
jgi:hypothetical protein